MRLEVFSDYVCPFCWLVEPAVHELERRMPGLEVVWSAYELRPEPVPALDPNGDYLRRVWSASVYPLAEQLGIPIWLPPVQPRSRLAHQAAKWAGDYGRFDEMSSGIFRAFFERGEDIGRPEVLAETARSLGLDGDVLVRALEANAHLAEVLEDEATADRIGLSGVPAFVSGRAILVGMQTADELERLLQNGVVAGPGGRTPLRAAPVRLKRREE